MSFVATLATDLQTIDHPTWEDVENAICALDATRNSEVMLAPAPPLGPPDGDHHMGIGGGKDDQYIVYMTTDNICFWNLVSSLTRNEGKQIRMQIGGQVGEYREDQCVSREWALKAARVYFQDGQRAEGLNWTRS